RLEPFYWQAISKPSFNERLRVKASLQLKLSQNLTMTPQLQQAIKLLQLSTLELQLEIQQMLESNPLLEPEDEQEDTLAQRENREISLKDSQAESSDESDFDEDFSQAQFEQEVESSLYDLSPYDIQEAMALDPSQAGESE